MSLKETVYIRKAELSRVVAESQAAGTLTDEFLAALVPLVEGVRGRFGRMENPADLYQDAVVLVMRHLHKLDPARNLFSYLTTLIRNEVTKRYRERSKQERIARKVWEERKPKYRDNPRSIDRRAKG